MIYNFSNREKFFIKNDKYYKFFFFIISNLDINLPTKKVKTNLLNFNDFKVIYNILQLIYINNLLFNLDDTYILKNYFKLEIEHFIQKLYNEDLIELYFSDISINLTNYKNYYPEFIIISSLIDNNLNDEYIYTNIDQEIISDDDSVNNFFI
tara:strand:+ start:1133 stop:1588 length:456 start_codon:yes stop_codon:yes gene_type:complete